MASQMRTVVVDKIASIAQACGLSHEIRIATQDIPCEEGVVLVVDQHQVGKCAADVNPQSHSDLRSAGVQITPRWRNASSACLAST